uniref:AC transposase n=1 Tax=Cajanus cajan TaxID=3821 RepID=A0A151RW04_CAJCA|nr:hypothetical protein KK1_031672 [Cajanus cajan]KYP46722.1 hypothetical protein KK1_031687 [Cajanus cajan]
MKYQATSQDIKLYPQNNFIKIILSSGLCLDVPIRWNSIFLMLQSVLKYECDFGSLQLVDENYKYCPLDEEWEKETRICKVLQPFYETTYEYSILLAFGAILDPKIKLETLGYCYERIDLLTWEIKLEKVKEKVYMFFSYYSSQGSKLNVQNLKRKDVSSSSINSKQNHFDVSCLL